MKKAVGDASIREKLAKDAELSYDKLRQVFLEALDTKKQYWVSCRRCGMKTPAELPDMGARVKAAIEWLNQGFGSPRQSVSLDIESFSSRDLDKMSAEERSRLAAAALELLRERGVTAGAVPTPPELPPPSGLEVFDG